MDAENSLALGRDVTLREHFRTLAHPGLKAAPRAQEGSLYSSPPAIEFREPARRARRAQGRNVPREVKPRTQSGEAHVGHTEGDQLVGVVCQVYLESRVQRQNRQPAREVSLTLDDLT